MKQFDFPSSSSPKTYHTLINDNGLLSCDCPGWTVKKEGKARFCKHCKTVAADEGLTLEERDGQMFVIEGNKKKTASAIITDPDAAWGTGANSRPTDFISPMLASSMPQGKDADSFNSDWVLEPKYDGHRIIVRITHAVNDLIDAAMVQAWSRPGNVRTLPDHIKVIASDLPTGVYDGELITPQSEHSYSVTAGQNSGTEVLVLFDMIEVDGKSIAKCEQHVRRAFLQIAYGAITHGETWLRLAPQLKPSMAAVQDIWDGGGEGAIIKKLSAKYNPGWRSPDWIKVKAVANATLTIIGFVAGKNGPYSVVKLRDKDGIETTVKTLDNAMMRAFAKDPDNYIGKRVVISYQEKMPSGKYRHPMLDHLAGVGE